MRTRRKFSSKNVRAVSLSAGSGIAAATRQTPCKSSAKRRIVTRRFKITSQLLRKATNEAARSAAFQGSSLENGAGSSSVPAILKGSAAAGRETERKKAAKRAVRGLSAITRSSAGIGRDQFPVRIARAGLAGESPDVGDVGHAVGAPRHRLTRLVLRGRHDLREEAHGDLHHVALHLGMRDVGLFDRDETGFGGFAARLALADGGREIIEHVAGQ